MHLNVGYKSFCGGGILLHHFDSEARSGGCARATANVAGLTYSRKRSTCKESQGTVKTGAIKGQL
eukprot:6175839-Pleurochrysis_carterae.AAC.2